MLVVFRLVGYSVGLYTLFLDSFYCMSYLHFDPAIDRRIIYNDFRSNPYLHFGAGSVPRALGVQLGEFHPFICSFIVAHLLYFIHASLYDLVVNYLK